jgi:hypothetical protein
LTRSVILAEIRRSVQSCIELDKPILRQLIEEVQPLVNNQRRIQPRSTTSVSLVAADGGNNDLRFDPFQVQIIRIVDSNQNEYWTEVISPTTPSRELNRKHLDNIGKPISLLGKMMVGLGVQSLSQLRG